MSLLRFVIALVFSVGCLSAVVGHAARAQERAIVFGDSLTDDGNWAADNPGLVGFFDLNADGGASNGPLWAEQLFGPMNSPVQTPGVVDGNINMAYIGARSDGLITPSLPHVFGAIGLPDQITAYLGAGGTIGPNDLIAVWAGANNIRECIDDPTVCLPAAGDTLGNAAAAANSQIASVQTLIGLSGRTILVPNHTTISATPYYPDGSPQQADALASANVFNSVLFSGLQNLAASAPPGTNIIHADINAVQRLIRSNPGAFGLSNVDDACKPSTIAPACADPDNYYYWDFIHPTSVVHGYYALYFSLLLDTAPAILDTAPLGDSLHASSGLVTDAVFDRLMNWFSGPYAFKNGPYVELLGQLGRYDGGGQTAGFDLDLGGLRLGWDHRSQSSLIGASIAVLSGEQDAQRLSSDVSVVRGDIYGSYVMGPVYGSFDAGVGGVWFDDVERDTGFGPVVADSETEGYTVSVAAEVGVAQNLGGVTLIPSARLTYVHAEVDDFRESAPILALEFDERESDAVLGRVSLRAVTQANLGAWPTSLFAEIGYEDYFSFSGNEMTASLVNNTALPTVVDPGDLNGPGLLGKLGLSSSQLSETMYLDVNYGISSHNGDGETHSGRARLKAHF